MAQKNQQKPDQDINGSSESSKGDEQGKMRNFINKIPKVDFKGFVAGFFKKISSINLKEFNIKKIKKNHIWILLGILIGVFILAHTVGNIRKVFMGKKQEDVAEVEIATTVPVKVYKVKRMDFKDTLPVMGRIEGFKEVELKFDSKGNLESFNFEEGERILEGDIIASLDQKDALLKLKYASLELEKAKKMFELGGVDKLALSQKELEYESAKRDLEKTNIYAPSDGYLGSKEKSVGAFLTSQDKVGIFVDYGEVYGVFDVIEEDSPKLELGQNAEIYLDAYPGASYSGTVDMISPIIEGRTRTQKIKIELENEDNELKPGMFARAIINTYEKKDALIIPASSFKKQENKFFVYVVKPSSEIEAEESAQMEDKEAKEKQKALSGIIEQSDTTAEEAIEEDKGEEGVIEVREVEIEYLTHDVAEIGKGLSEGELIIRELHREYKDKERVEIAEIQETIF